MSTISEIWELPEGQAISPELQAATEVLTAHIRPGQIFAVVRRRASGLGGRSLLEIAHDGDARAVLSLVRSMFAYDDANS